MKRKYLSLFLMTSIFAVGTNILFIQAAQARGERRLVRLMIRLLVRSSVHPSIWLIGLSATVFAGYLFSQKIR